MQNSSSDFIIVTNELAVSGKFIGLAQSGQLELISKAIQDRVSFAKELSAVEGKLKACSDPAMLAELAIWCFQRKQDFESKLRKVVAKLETRKCQLLAALQQSDQRLAQEDPSVEWTMCSAPLTSLVPRIVRKKDPYVVERNEAIDDHLDLRDQEICRLLDQNFARDGHCFDHLPKPWVDRYEVHTFTDAYRHPECRRLVHKMISVRRRLCAYPKI